MYYTCLNIARTFRVHYIIWQNFHVALSIIYMCLKRDKWSKFVSSSFPLYFVFFCRYSKILKPRLHTCFPYLLRRCSFKKTNLYQFKIILRHLKMITVYRQCVYSFDTYLFKPYLILNLNFMACICHRKKRIPPWLLIQTVICCIWYV